MKNFGDYEAEELIARGGQGQVWLARHRETGQSCALKILPVEADDRARKRFIREAKALQALESPHVVRLLQVCSDDPSEQDSLWYAMELAPEGSLRDRVGSDWAMADRHRAFIHTCMGVQAAHQAGIVHRDLKPDNVLCFPGPLFKVADFGIIRREQPDTTTVTTSRQVIGTMYYWSPEHWRDPSSVDPRSDIYSLGVVLYEILIGELPFLQGRSHLDVAAEVEEPYRALLARMLHPSPGERYQSTAEVLQALALVEAMGGGPKVVAPNLPWTEERASTFCRWIRHVGLSARQVEALEFVVCRFPPNQIRSDLLYALAGEMRVTHLTASRHFYNACRLLGIGGIPGVRAIRAGTSTPWA